ncbi:damage-inducible protein CinA [Paenalcaligenes hominis]|uniref:Damage-inducible protein CinA n=1 Tax=Paenalcaligenes hominis TaxID=643674 RepID=A0A1U9JZN1_9BURK|nr:nicotinamide-nucleotide amidohydrolase family protein [Paenalcaligenes hominis]AQS51255.1 damage-inducible protein CinA [Paenalcaligenes hominis]
MFSSSINQAVHNLAQRLLAEQVYITTAESCTGGLIAAAFTTLSGSSAWFERGYVTYSNSAKQEDLGVLIDTLERYGAVSEQTAMEMAKGALEMAAQADVALATTGIAGPTGATPGKPVGMVCFGFARRTDTGIVAHALTQVFTGDRGHVREQAVLFAVTQAIDVVTPHLVPPQPSVERTGFVD